MSTLHTYKSKITWTGNTGTGTADYKTYERSHIISIQNKADIQATSDPAFRGDKTKHNPEDLFLSALSSCHMLWYLHLCTTAGINVLSYEDNPVGIMEESYNGSGKFTEVTLHPAVLITDTTQIDKANALHHEANKMCFIANSCNFEVKHQPSCTSNG
ncbi:OsmC family protein [Cytophaga aurantiaca]|uniref:OsmC family protein n=1 Tax=Cytophaga aurantiaca TaxID=29530 RepID=UPI00037F4725|nr:OsmC family protein [Cytophaga aurantiaca]